MKADFVNKRMKRILKSRNYKIMQDTVYSPRDAENAQNLNLSLFYKTLEEKH